MYKHLKEKFIRLGCNNSKIIALSIQVYLDLCEVKKYWDVEYLYDQSINKIYFNAKVTKTAEPALFIPVEVSESLSFNDLQNLLKLNTEKKLYIAIVSSDSTCVYYEISNGLVETFQEKNESLERSRQIDAEIRKNRALIEQAALYNIPITLKKKPQPKRRLLRSINNKTKINFNYYCFCCKTYIICVKASKNKYEYSVSSMYIQ